MLSRSQLVFKLIDILGYPLQNGVAFPNIKKIKDVPYVPNGDSLHSGNIYYNPYRVKDGNRLPVILNIHGGGFVMGDKDYRWSLSEFYAHNGLFVYDINYGLSPKAVFPENCNDCVDALNFLIELAKEYPIDLDRVIISGDSSGAYMATYITALAFDDELRKSIGGHEIKIKPAALASFCGIYDVETLLHVPVPFGIIQDTASQLLGMKIKRDMSNLKDAPLIDKISPSQFVNENWCPVFIVWTDSDVICIDQGPAMAKVLKEKCKNVTTFSTDGLLNNHCFHLIYRTKEAKRCMAAFIRFLKENKFI